MGMGVASWIVGISPTGGVPPSLAPGPPFREIDGDADDDRRLAPSLDSERRACEKRRMNDRRTDLMKSKKAPSQGLSVVARKT